MLQVRVILYPGKWDYPDSVQPGGITDAAEWDMLIKQTALHCVKLFLSVREILTLIGEAE